MSEQREITGTITNARFIEVGAGRHILAGTIIGDVHRRFRDGETIYTSDVKDVVGDIAITENSRYRFRRRH